MLRAMLAAIGRRRRREPSLAELLTDPIVKIAMEADKIDPQALEQELRKMARTISGFG